MQALELLAPAKNSELGIAAINCGADAVYIGAPKFGARTAVGNSFADIEKLVKHSHKYFAKTYLALNTLLFDNELDEALDITRKAYNMGVDALIIQDMGLLELDLPPIPLFASTQTNNATAEKALFLQNVGFQRVILARELSVSQIKEIRSKTTVDLECFVHGAICVCYSGQCNLSYALTGRSGNRGECAQPCRYQYDLVNDHENVLISKKHLLSPKDMNQGENLELLIDAGVTSFKIEGRLKDIDYVRNITAFYRQKLDAVIEKKNGVLKKSSSGKCYFDFIPDPSRTFNRGYTDYFIQGRQKDLASFLTPKSLGKQIGEVVKVNKDSLVIKLIERLTNGDGLCFVDNSMNLKGFRVNRVEGSVVYPLEMPDVEEGVELFRNHDQNFEKKLLASKTTRKIKVSFLLTERPDGFRITATDEDGISVELAYDCIKQPAKSIDKRNEMLIAQLKKTGNTIFEACDIEIQFSENWFLATSVVNEMRRQVLQKLEDERVLQYKRNEIKISQSNYKYPALLLDYRGNVVNEKAMAFYRRHGVTDIEQGLELQSNFSKKVLMTTRYCIKYETNACPKHKGAKPWQGTDFYIKSGKNKLRVEFDCVNCQMNIYLA